MASGKKGKKTKGKTFALTDFLQETPGTAPTVPIRKSANWADEVEEYDGYESRFKTNMVLPTAPKASRDFDDISEKVPKEPPYWAYLSNLPYDVDEEEIASFFKNLKIANMKIPKDDRSSDQPKLKGFGYVEFEDRESLLNALVIPDTTLKSRRIRIEVAANVESDRRRGRMDMGRDRQERSDVAMGDWRSGPRTESSEMDRNRGFSREGNREGGFGRDSNRDGGSFNRENMRDSGFNRERERDSGFSRERDSNREEDRGGSWRDNERLNRNNDRGFTRRNDYNDRRFDDRERDGERSSSRGFGSSRRYEDRNEDRNGSDSERLAGPGGESRQRPKLNLAPRSQQVESSQKETPVPSASIFGNAKPVDTSHREREIEEKLAKEHQEKSPDELGASKERKNVDEKLISRRRADSPKDVEVAVDEREGEDDEKKDELPKKDKLDKELPKVKEAEPPNFAASNKYAFLETEDSD